MRNTKFFLAAVTAYGIWGFFSLVLRPLRAYPSFDILFYRIILCAVLLLLVTVLFGNKKLRAQISLFRNQPPALKKKIILLNISGSIFLTINWFSFIYVMNNVSVKATSLAYLVCPILTACLACLILKEKLWSRQWAGIAISLAGCLVLSFAQLTDMLYGLLVASPYALYLVSQRQNSGFDKFFVLTFQVTCSALLLLPFYPYLNSSVSLSSGFWSYIVIIAAGFTILPLWLNLYALKGLPSSTVGMLVNINPLIAFSLALFYFQEATDAWQLLGYGIIAFAVILFNTVYLKKKHNN